MRRPGLLVLLLAVAVSSCRNSDSPAPARRGYAEGPVTIETNHDVHVGRFEMKQVVQPATADALRKFEGLDVAVVYDGNRADIVSPVEDTWRAFGERVNVPADVDPRLKPLWIPGTSPRATFPDQVRLTALVDSYRSIDTRYRQFSAASTRPSDIELHGLAVDVKTLVSNALGSAAATTDPLQQQLLINIAADGQRKIQTGTLKSYEAGLRRAPQFYRNVGREAGATIAVTRLNGIIGTGFLISRQWVLTNRHVMVGILDWKQSTTVTFDREDPAFPPPIIATSCAITDLRIADSASPLDLAALKFQCPAGFPPSWDGRVLRLATRRTVLNEGVYVVGHPSNGPKQVVDNAFIRYPFQVDDVTHRGLRLLISNVAERDMFDEFYQPCDGGNWCYRTSLKRWNKPGAVADIPTVGFDSNTEPGNSGSPLMSALDNSVIGIFFGGARDYQVEGPWSFSRHEAAIPSTVILDWLKSVGIAVP